MKGSRLFIDDRITLNEDFFLSLYNAYLNRYCLIDSRYHFQQVATFKNRGGHSEFRNLPAEEYEFKILKQMFGPCVIQKPLVGNLASRKSHDFEKLIKLPF